MRSQVIFFLVVCFSMRLAAQQVSGTITDGISGEPLFGASVLIKGTTIGAQTDFDGKFEFDADTEPPFTLVIAYLGYEEQEVEITSGNINKPVKISLEGSSEMLQKVEVVDTRITEKQKESPLTVESMGLAAIKQTPSADFYSGLGHLKGVDLTTASIGFVVVNTRGFNSTRPVRSLQLVDGADNQAPGLNFSLGNFAGVSELDIQKVDLIVGASGAFYGPNAFNGVILMTRKNPFYHPGLSVSVKYGERHLFETAIRYARVVKNKKGNDKFAFKINFAYMRANDWEATNYDPTEDSEEGRSNFGGYDAVNIYGDETQIDYTSQAYDMPGLGKFYRTGYKEKDLVDYSSRNIKAAGSIHYKITSDIEAEYTYNFGTGTTVYQGDNRYSLKGLKVQQHKLEIGQKDKFFIRAYHTREDAGQSYDAVFTALILQEMAAKNTAPFYSWQRAYSGYYSQRITKRVAQLPGFPDRNNIDLWFTPDTISKYNTYEWADSIIMQNADSMFAWHEEVRLLADSENPFRNTKDRLEPGTQAFIDSFNAVISRKTFLEGGSGFYDKSSLTHVQGEYKYTPDLKTVWYDMNVTAGGGFRLYTPDSRGTIFLDTAKITELPDGTKDTSFQKITNYEYGVYVGTEQRLANKKLIVTGVVRMDKNQNFDFLFSPAASIVYKLDKSNTFRLSFSSAIRNPTLQDQYLYYNVGRAILIGNLEGFENLVTRESFLAALEGSSFRTDSLEYFSVQPVRPEKVKSIEVGYKGILMNSLYIDASYYFSWYRDFLGYKLGAEVTLKSLGGQPFPDWQFYRVSANSSDMVTTQGFSIGLSYYFKKYFAISGNYSWNVLDRRGSDDEIIPAFNTPEHKFNVGISGRDIVTRIGKRYIRNWGFNINYKWIQGFLYEGSPQFTGRVPTYDMLDVQINYKIPKIYTTIKVGATNVLNQKSFQTYGGPYIGRLAYVSLLFEMDKL